MIFVSEYAGSCHRFWEYPDAENTWFLLTTLISIGKYQYISFRKVRKYSPVMGRSRSHNALKYCAALLSPRRSIIKVNSSPLRKKDAIVAAKAPRLNGLIARALSVVTDKEFASVRRRKSRTGS